MPRSAVRVYADTSVYGGVFDDEFRRGSIAFLEQVGEGRFELVISQLCRDEIDGAPARVRQLFTAAANLAEVVETTDPAVRLRDAYLAAGIVSAQYDTDALHVALATVSGCSIIVSWNFKHIVNVQKTPLYNAVNALHGYDAIRICSPPEVIEYAEEAL